jgi:hypothetical protein
MTFRCLRRRRNDGAIVTVGDYTGRTKTQNSERTLEQTKHMKLKMLVAAGVLAMGINAGTAAHVWEDPNGWWSDHFIADQGNAPKFTAQELSLDLFGSYMARQENFSEIFETDIRSGGHWGGGVGLNYFFLREVGVGADINMSNNGSWLVDLVAGNVIVRLPIESAGLAPYLIGGGGRGIDPSWEWFAHAGVGLEARFTRTAGVFIDSRYIWAEKSYDKLQFRAGVRLTL